METITQECKVLSRRWEEETTSNQDNWLPSNTMTKFVGRYDPIKNAVTWDNDNEPANAKGGGGFASVARSYARPLKSQAMACHPEQVEDFNKQAASGVRYLSDGTCEISSRQARNEELKLRGFVDNDGGYGDHC